MTDDTVLHIEREFNAAPEDVFDAWVKPEIFVKWWGPEGMTTPVHELNVHEGGRWSATMENAEGKQYTSSGVYKILDRPHRLVFTWAWTQEDGSRGHETDIDVTFKPNGAGTRMILRQGIFQDIEARDSHNMGWTSSFNDLARVLG